MKGNNEEVKYCVMGVDRVRIHKNIIKMKQ